MNKAFLVLSAVTFIASICFAEEASMLDSADDSANLTQASSNTSTLAQVSSSTNAPTPLPDIALIPSGTATFTGEVDFAYSGDNLSETNPQITVKDNEGKGTTFVVASDATILDKDASITNLDWIDNGDKVSVEYITEPDGTTKTAKCIKMLPDR